MKVSKLIEQLSKLDGEIEVVTYSTEDSRGYSPIHMFWNGNFWRGSMYSEDKNHPYPLGSIPAIVLCPYDKPDSLRKPVPYVARMPVHPYTKAKHPKSWPMEPFINARGMCIRNHSQSPEKLASRGGLSPSEALAVLTGKRYREVSDEYNDDHALINIGKLVGEEWDIS